MNDKSNGTKSQLRTVGNVATFTRSDARTINVSAVAAVKVGHRDGITSNAKKTVASAHLWCGEAQVAVRTTTDHDVVSNSDSTHIGRLILQFKYHFHTNDSHSAQKAGKAARSVLFVGAGLIPAIFLSLILAGSAAFHKLRPTARRSFGFAAFDPIFVGTGSAKFARHAWWWDIR